MNDLRLDAVAAHEDGRKLAVAEALDFNAFASSQTRLPLFLGEELLRTEAVADGADADANGVDRHLQEGIEGDDLVHFAATDVHVVGEGVGELGGQRADLVPHPPEVVEEARALALELGQELREAKDVHGPIILCRRSFSAPIAF
jgi:hypothetical protein